MELCYIALIIFSMGLQAEAQSHIVIFSKYIHPGEDLAISVNCLQEIPKRETVHAELLLDRERTVLSKVAGQASSELPDIILKLRVPKVLTQWRYIVRVHGYGSFEFSDELYVSVQRKAITTLVQSDKAIYKPGDKVLYRVFAISDNLDRVDMVMDVNLYDPEGNKIDEYNGVKADPVWKGELLLSDMPNLGKWKIEVLPTAITIRKSLKKEEVRKAYKINKKQRKCDREVKEGKIKKCYNSLLWWINHYTEIETSLLDYEIMDPKIIDGAKTSYTFEVLEYVLPNFEVTLNMPKYGVIDDTYLSGTIHAKYLTGKPVKGYAEVSVSRPWFYGFHDPKAIRMSTMMTGEWRFQVPKKLLDRLTRSFEHRSLKVKGSVTEMITGIKHDISSNIYYYDSPYKVTFHPSMPTNFKPGLRYPVMVKVSYQDDSPALNLRGKIKITATYFAEEATNETIANEVTHPGYDVVAPFDQGETIMIEPSKYRLNEAGIVFFDDLLMPKDASTGTIKAEYKRQSVYMEISRFRSKTDNFLRIVSIDVGQLKIGGRIVFRVESTIGAVGGKYLVIAKQKVISHGSFYINSDERGSIVFLLRRTMAPAARLLVYIVNNGEIIADAVTFTIEEMYENKVSVRFDQKGPVKPQADIKLSIRADPESVFFVLAGDKRVRLLKEGNDITRERVEAELGLYYNDLRKPYTGWGRYRPWSDIADDSSDLFNIAGLNIFTDAFLYSYRLKEKQPIFVTGPIRPMSPIIRKTVDAAESGRSETPQGQIRQKFPETWLWISETIGKSGETEIKAKVPDTITQWDARAYAIHPVSGLGVAPGLASIIGFLEFFVSMELPYSVVQGELVILQANVFNYHPDDLNVLVTLKNFGEFEGLDLASDGTETTVEGNLTRCVFVKSGTPTPVFFHVKPTIIGAMKINVRIEETDVKNIFDEIIKVMSVKAEGEEMALNIPVLVTHRMDKSTSRSIAIIYPDNTVPNSQRIQVTVFGDLFGPALNNIDRLIRIPYGCGEQNMIRFAPAVFAAAYLMATGRFVPNTAFVDRARAILLTGYQRELLYKRHNGSFSAFGNADREGSTWLTAFVMKSFAQAVQLNLIMIDPNVMDSGVNYIINNQNVKGNFKNTGVVFHRRLQGGSVGSEGSLAAYILIALQEVKESNVLKNPDTKKKLDYAIDRATDYLNNYTQNPLSDYQAAILAFANPDNNVYLEALENSENKSLDGGMHWTEMSRALQIETAGYALLAYSRKGDVDTGNMILEWLVKQRNPYAGFMSTQDTVVALQALEEIATLIYTKDVNMEISVSTVKNMNNIAFKKFVLNENNHDVLQFVDLDGNVDSIVVEATGTGSALVDINKFFNVYKEPLPPSYTLTVSSHDESPQMYMLQVCTRYLIPGESSGMAIMSVNAISGYEPLKNGISHNLIKRVEASGGTLSIYFEQRKSEMKLKRT